MTHLGRRLLALPIAALVLALLSVPASAQPAPRTDGGSGDLAPLGPGFLWGVASAGFQSEGYSPDSNWSRYAAKKEPVGTSVDFLHRYAEDIALARDLGVKVYRISVEWARVEPRPGVQDPAAWAFYDHVVAAIRDAGMRPMITLDHWVYPGWEADKGGWGRPGMANDWLANARRVVDRYASYNPLWVTFNEPSFYAVQETTNGGLLPLLVPVMMAGLVRAHNTIYDYIHARQPGAMVTSNVAYIPTVEPVLDLLFLDQVAQRLDFVGLDYYYPVSLTDPSAIYSLIGQSWKSSLAADGLYYALRHYARQFPGKPLYVVENGMPTENGLPRADGYDRADLLRDSIYWVQRAKADGINVIGYNYWSLTDNYEWGSYTPRFGLYTVDVLTDPTLTRRPTDAVPAYRDITAANGVPADYRPTRSPGFCSLVDFLSSCLDPVRVP
jgi:beta-glucosidase